MCLIILNTHGGNILTEKELRLFADDSPHGYGLAIARNGKLEYEKDISYGAYPVSLPDEPWMLHFRFATHGENSIENCHPFELTERTCLAHNGILSPFMWDASKSDTWHFVETLKDYIKKTGFGPNDSEFQQAINLSLGCDRMATFDANGGAIYYGKWHHDKTRDILFSRNPTDIKLASWCNLQKQPINLSGFLAQPQTQPELKPIIKTLLDSQTDDTDFSEDSQTDDLDFPDDLQAELLDSGFYSFADVSRMAMWEQEQAYAELLDQGLISVKGVIEHVTSDVYQK